MTQRHPDYRLAERGSFPFLRLDGEVSPLVAEWERHERLRSRDGGGWYVEPETWFWSFSFESRPLYFVGRTSVTQPLPFDDSTRARFLGKPPEQGQALGNRRHRIELGGSLSTHAGRAAFATELTFDLERLHCHVAERVTDVDIGQ